METNEKLTTMSNNFISYVIIILISTTISCGQISSKQINISINDNEYGLVVAKKKRYVLTTGEHEVDQDSKVTIFSKIDSLTINEFDILDINGKGLFCKTQIKYSFTVTHIDNIADLLKSIHSNKSYKEILFVPEIRSAIRYIAGNYMATDLENQDNQHLIEIEKGIVDRLEKYADLVSFELMIYEK